MATPERAEIQDVNIDLGDDVSKMLYQASLLTHANRPRLVTEAHGSFSGFRGISLRQFEHPEDLIINMGFDGVGTKIEIAERIEDHSGVAHDLFAMVCDDAVVRGAEPVAIGTILDVRQLDDTEYTKTSIKQLAQGYVDAARESGVVVVNGEIAELGDRVGGHGQFNYNWGAAVLWLAHKNRALTGHDIREGDALIGLAEEGFRSNGITDVRKAMKEEHGDEWHSKKVPELGDETLGKQVSRPSRIYTRLVTELTGGYDINRDPRAKITGVAHITGGGIPSKLGRMLEPSGLGAKIDSPLPTPEIIQYVRELRGFYPFSAAKKWHYGTGMIIATPEPDKVLEVAEELAIKAQQIGSVCASSRISIYVPARGSKLSKYEHYYLPK